MLSKCDVEGIAYAEARVMSPGIECIEYQ